MLYLWPRSHRKVPSFNQDLLQLDFVRSLKEPCILSKDFTTNFQTDIFLADYKNEHGIKPVDYEKFLSYFGMQISYNDTVSYTITWFLDPNHEVNVEKIDSQSGQKVYQKMSLIDFIYLLQEGGDSQVYLKDWHAQKYVR